MQELLRGEGSQEAHCGGGGRAGGEKCPLTVGGEPRMASPSHEPPGTLHTWDSWSSMHAATTQVPQREQSGNKWRAWMQLSLIRNALGVSGEIPAG